jgi:hypothetical protein
MSQEEMMKDFARQNVEREEQLAKLIEKVESLDEKMEARRREREEQLEKITEAVNSLAREVLENDGGASSANVTAEELLEAAKSKEARATEMVEGQKKEASRLGRIAQSLEDRSIEIERASDNIRKTPKKLEKAIENATAELESTVSLLRVKGMAIVILTGVVSAIVTALLLT